MTVELVLRAPAKINWSLAVLGKRPDGYHELNSLMQNVALYDTVRISRSEADSCQCIPDPCPGADNLALRAWYVMKERYRLEEGLRITIEKRIPAGGGLAGGSADAAAVIIGVNELFHLNAPFKTLEEIAFSLGADLPFCLNGGMALVEGAGEIVRPIMPGMIYELFLVYPGISLSTSAVFAGYDKTGKKQKAPDLARLLPALFTGDRQGINDSIGNMLETPAFELCPEIEAIKKMLARAGCVTLMSGSGSCLWALPPEDPYESMAVRELLEAKGLAYQRASTLANGIELI